MRIIKEGKVAKPIEFIMKCPYCKTIFTYLKTDIDIDCYDYTDFLKCPVCHEEIIVPFFKKKYKGDSNES